MRDLSQPVQPADFYSEQIDRETAQRAAAASPPQSPFTGSPDTVLTKIAAGLDAVRQPSLQLLHELHGYAETAFEEHQSAAAISRVLSEHGIPNTVGVHGLDTAVRAEIGSTAGRTIAIMGEYDALPGIGHGCGHNVIGSAGLAAFLALAQVEREQPGTLPGRVVFLGTPAEEGHTGKEIMARNGALDGLDAAIMLHGYCYDFAEQTWLGRRILDVTFTGVPAHASAQPFMGRNALDAANLFYQGLGLLRQQMPPVDRIHAIITEGGTRASIITERAKVEMYLRSKFPETLKDLSGRVEDMARGAALMTGTGVEISWDRHPASLPVRTNSALTAHWSRHQETRGRSPLPAGVLDESIAASTDFGNVSYRVPGIHPLIKIAGADITLHSREFAHAAQTPEAEQGMLDGAYGLACTASDFLFDDDLAGQVRADFEAAGGTVDVEHFFD